MQTLNQTELSMVSGGKTPPYTVRYVREGDWVAKIIDYAPGSGWKSDVYVYHNGKFVESHEV
jgi:hypothetical protein